MKNKKQTKQELPTKPDFTNPPAVAVSILIKMRHLKAVSLLASRDPARYVLNGVLVEYNGKHLILVACDGRKLGVLNEPECLPVPDDSNQPFAYIVPTELINDASRLTRGRDVSVWLEFDEATGVSISTGDKTIKGKRIEGNYPIWKQVAPQGKEVPCNVSVNSLYLTEFHQAAKMLYGETSMYIRGSVVGDTPADMNAFSIKFADPNFFGVLIPLRVTEGHVIAGGIPEYVK